MQSPYKIIIDLLKNKHIEYETLEHEPVFTSEQAAKIRGTSLKQGAKALLLKADGEFILAVLPGDRRMESKKLKAFLLVRDMRFATPEEVEQIMGCKIGACYPFGNLIGVRMIVDPSLGENEIISFNPGVHDKSLKMKYKDYVKVTAPELVNIS